VMIAECGLDMSKIYPFYPEISGKNIDQKRARIRLGILTIPRDKTPPLNPASDAALIIRLAPIGMKEEVFDAITKMIRKYLKRVRRLEDIVFGIETIWGSRNAYEIIREVCSSVWELDGEMKLVRRRMVMGIHNQTREREVLTVTLLRTIFESEKAVLSEAIDKGRLIDVYVKSLRVVWSDVVEQIKCLLPISNMETFREIAEKSQKRRWIKPNKKKLFLPDIEPELLCPAYRKMLGGVPEGIRDFCAFAIVTLLRELGVERERAERLMLEWNKRNNPPLEERDIIEKVDYHYNNRYSPPSCDWIFSNCRLHGVTFCPENCKYKHPLEFIRSELGGEKGERANS